MGMLYKQSTNDYVYDSAYPDNKNWLAGKEDGWSIVPREFQSDIRQNHPYVRVTCEDINGVSTVTVVEDLPKPPPPEPGPTPPPEPDPVTLLQAQVKALDEQNAFLEDCLVEMAGVVYDY